MVDLVPKPKIADELTEGLPLDRVRTDYYHDYQRSHYRVIADTIGLFSPAHAEFALRFFYKVCR